MKQIVLILGVGGALLKIVFYIVSLTSPQGCLGGTLLRVDNEDSRKLEP